MENVFGPIWDVVVIPVFVTSEKHKKHALLVFLFN